MTRELKGGFRRAIKERDLKAISQWGHLIVMITNMVVWWAFSYIENTTTSSLCVCVCV